MSVKMIAGLKFEHKFSSKNDSSVLDSPNSSSLLTSWSVRHMLVATVYRTLLFIGGVAHVVVFIVIVTVYSVDSPLVCIVVDTPLVLLYLRFHLPQDRLICQLVCQIPYTSTAQQHFLISSSFPK